MAGKEERLSTSLPNLQHSSCPSNHQAFKTSMPNILHRKTIHTTHCSQFTAPQRSGTTRKLSDSSSSKSDIFKGKCRSREHGLNSSKLLILKNRSTTTSSNSTPSMEHCTIPRVKGEDLTLEKELKQGAQGITYTGTLIHGRTCIPVVIKELHSFNRDQLEKEAKVLQGIDGAGGAPVLFGVTQEEPFRLVMSYCPGDTLEHILNNSTPHDCLQVFIKLCDAVEQIHAKGFVHCDLHPENILVEKTASNVIIHIIDMGYAEPLTRGLFDEGTWRDYVYLLLCAEQISQSLDSSTKYAAFKSIVGTASRTGESIKLLVETAKVCCVEGIPPAPETQ